MEAHAESALKGSVRLGNYLRRLRAGYGYSLRRVEERAKAEGGEIDNSQLSRYEKGICYPSFDKLRVLASVFNVSVQAFSDVVDLEAYEGLKPTTGEPRAIVDDGNAAMRGGEYGRAFACYECALDLLHDAPTTDTTSELIAQTRINLAMALARLGKLALAEHELRQALRSSGSLPAGLSARALLNLANLHADQNDLLLAEIEADKALTLARAESLEPLAARALHTMGRVLAQRHQHLSAIERYRDAGMLYDAAGEVQEAIRVRINVGDSYVALGKIKEGIRLLRAALTEAHAAAHRRLEAQAWSNLGEAYYLAKEPAQAQSCLRQSDALAGSPERYPDILFFNAFYEWKMAIAQANPTREKIAFGRLKALRSGLERRFPESDAFDAFVERRRSDA
ncbi:MAG TPA: helix-turn-helix domain-containing protein [Candidatus Polarisedimenticolaceae bacterium]|nr:helix-turn-helix domain-containing protein [Candidatus Polarisedimenticolaceae bacterium]